MKESYVEGSSAPPRPPSHGGVPARSRSMAILAMSRRAILALPWLGKPTGK